MSMTLPDIVDDGIVKKIPEEHLLEHAVGGVDSRETAGGQRVELQV